MLLLVSAVFALNFQVQVGSDHRRTPVVRDSTVGDTTRRNGRRLTRGIRQPVTEELARTAFKDATARITLLKARDARMRQDSALVSYDAMSYQRMSAGMSLTSIGRDRLVFRHESATRVRWQQNVGVWMDVKGARTVVPIAGGDDARNEMRNETSSDPDMAGAIPYYPGYEPLWIGGGMARAQVDETELVNPIAEGAEAYYTYETGDSISFRLPDGKTIRLRELKVRPRQPKWNLAVGSLWFDTNSGQVVRAAYRLAVPIDVWGIVNEDDPSATKDIPIWVKPLIMPMKAEITAIAVEYGLHEGRFWLPRLRLAEGSAQVSFMHVPVKMEESFTYASVNGTDTLPPIQLASPGPRPPDSLSADARAAWLDSVRVATRQANRLRLRAQNDSIRRGLKARVPAVNACDTADARVSTYRRYDASIPVAVRVPCDAEKLEHSPDLPKSIYDPGEELFGAKELESLKNEALSLSAQAPFTVDRRLLPKPTYDAGLSMLRYNRIEGLSVGASVEQQLGGGYAALALGRLGVADLEPNVELTLTRTNLTKSVFLSGYNHLVSANDWGRPLSFSSSFAALMFGRDEGFYYRASGAEIGGATTSALGGGAHAEWRAFVEEQRSAAVNSNFAVNGADFPANVVARRGLYEGVGARLNNSYGLDPSGFRLFSDLRVEAAAGDSAYGRAALDVTGSHGMGRLAAAITLAGGSSVGALPPQRMWFLGGSQTVRGQNPDVAQSGNAFWLTRLEVGSNESAFRPTVFGDLGWVGDRTKLSQVGRPLSGIGAGVSVLDGMFRFDVARGIYPRQQFRVDLSLESKF